MPKDVDPAVRVEVECDGQRHSIEWTGGDLRLVDHDEEAERVGEALGGRLPYCVRLAIAWRRFYPRQVDSLIALCCPPAPKSSSDGGLDPQSYERLIDTARVRVQGGVRTILAMAQQSGVEDWEQPATAEILEIEENAEDFLTLVEQPSELLRLYAENVLHQSVERWSEPDVQARFGEALERLLHALVNSALGEAARASGDAGLQELASLPNSWRLTPPGTAPIVRRTSQAELIGPNASTAVTTADGIPDTVPSEWVAQLHPESLYGELPVNWLVDVWLNGVSVVGDAFVLAAQSRGDADTLHAVVLEATRDARGRAQPHLTRRRLRLEPDS